MGGEGGGGAAEGAEEVVGGGGERKAGGGGGGGVTAVAAAVGAVTGREITRMCPRHVEEAGEARRAAEGRQAEMGTHHLGVVVEREVVVGEGRVATEVKGLGRVGRRSDSLIESRGQFHIKPQTSVFIIRPKCTWQPRLFLERWLSIHRYGDAMNH